MTVTLSGLQQGATAQALASSMGGTGNLFTKFTGPTTTEKTFTLPNANATLLYSGGALGTPLSGDFSSGTFTWPTFNQSTTGQAGSVASAVTFAVTGGAAAGSTFNGSAAKTVDYSTVGAAPASHTHSYEAADGDLLAIAGLVGTTGYLKKTAADTWTLDTTTFPSASSSTYIGTTAVALNRASGALALTGITSIDGTATNLAGTPNITVGTIGTSVITASADAVIHGLTVGLGAGSVSTNTVLGTGSFATNSVGGLVVAVGYNALAVSTTGSHVAVGYNALVANSTGVENTAIGLRAMQANTTGGENTAVGRSALVTNLSGSFNTAVGKQALQYSTNDWNTALGYFAGKDLTSGSNNLLLGYNAQASAVGASNETVIGNTDTKITKVHGNTTVNDLTLVSMGASLHYGAIVKLFLYDTSKDSDGGAWRKRCTDKSWYTETLGGDRWIGQRASNSAAWTAAGSATGAVYQSTADGLYYTPTSASTQTQVYRGIRREFPEQVGVVAQDQRVIIYDMTAIGCPMWMSVPTSAGGIIYSSGGDNHITSVAALNGVICTGTNPYDLYVMSFVKDLALRYGASAGSNIHSSIGDRNSVVSWSSNLSYPILITREVNDVAMAILDGAPVDPATGLPTPTIAVATNGGTSLIQGNGVVVNYDEFFAATGVRFSGNWLTIVRPSDAGTRTALIDRILTANFSAYGGNYYHIQGGAANQGVGCQALMAATIYNMANTRDPSMFAYGGAGGLDLAYENPSTPPKGMVSYITSTYNTGWLPGDIRGSYLADTVAETLTGSGELVSNGAFTSNTTGWTVVANGTLSIVSASLKLLNDSSGVSGAYAYQTITTVSGKRYTVTVTVGVASTISAGIRVGTSAGDGSLLSYTNAQGHYNFTATGTSTCVQLCNANGTANAYSYFDDVSVKLAEPDRSVKAKGLVINGTLTKSAVASGSALVAYSGFSASNYLEQPYNSDLDFGTGDFCVMGWVKLSTSDFSIYRAVTASGGTYLWNLTFGGNGDAYSIISTWATNEATTAVIPSGVWSFFTWVRTSGSLKLYSNGILVGTHSTFNGYNLSGSTYSLFISSGVTPGSTAAALIRISATAPSADQIAQIYRDELPLFQAGAQCTIGGSSTAVTALANDEVTDLLHVGTSQGRSAFKGLLRTEYEPSGTGAITSISAHGGTVLTGGTSAYAYIPAVLLRDELKRRDEARKALGKVPVSIDFVATASQTAFVLTKGYTAKFVYVNGLLQRLTGQYTVSNDGYQETVTMVTGVPVSQYVTIISVRSN